MKFERSSLGNEKKKEWTKAEWNVNNLIHSNFLLELKKDNFHRQHTQYEYLILRKINNSALNILVVFRFFFFFFFFVQITKWTIVIIYQAFCLDAAQGRMNGAPSKTRTHLWRFANLACLLLHYSRRPIVIYEALCIDVAQGRLNGTPNETRNLLWRFASLACWPLHDQRCPKTDYWYYLEYSDYRITTFRSRCPFTFLGV